MSYRKLKDINLSQFKQDIATSSLVTAPKSAIEDLVDQYNNVLTDILDKHAPIKTKLKTARPITPWYNEEIRKAKAERRKAERKWRTTKLTVHHQIFKELKNQVCYLIDKSKQQHYSESICEHQGNQKVLFKTVNILLNNKKVASFPNDKSDKNTSDRFSNFFVEKIQKIRNDLESIERPDIKEVPHRNLTCSLHSFQLVSEEEIRKIVMSSPSKSCILDPIPTNVLKDCIDELLPFITKVVNTSLSSSTVPSSLKNAIVSPILKKPDLDIETLKNYRPISNLPFLAKVLEKVIAQQLDDHIESQNMQEPMQSAYRKHHSTETALVRVQNDVLEAIDHQQCVLLVLLDLSAAFDTVDHNVLVRRLECRFGVTGNAIEWIKSYLDNRKQSVLVNGVFSKEQVLTCNIPQGSVLGPKFFKDYSSALAELVRSLGVQLHMYADDTQLYFTFKPTSEKQAVNMMERCIIQVRLWMAANFLKLNDEKTEFIVIGTPQQLTKVTSSSVKIGDVHVMSSDVVRNIGAQFDKNMKLEQQVNCVCRSAWHHFRNIAKIKKFLTKKDTETLLHSLVTNKIDHHNALLYGLGKNLINRLQKIHNAAAKLLMGKRKFDHVTPLLQELHWLPVEYRITYKIALLVYKSLHGQGPIYLQELLHWYSPVRALRSSANLELTVPSRSLAYGTRAFSYAGPTVWNSLPLTVKKSNSVDTFKKHLKSYLFRAAFPEK